MPRIESFRDLEVYQLGLREAKRVFLMTKEFPREERYSLTELDRAWQRVGAMLNRMIQRADTFCRSTVR